MADKTIGLKIQLNGVDTIIKDVKSFEIEIKKAREDLKQLEIGSSAFKKLSSEIGLAESSMLGLIQSTKRLTKEREIEGIGKLGQGIASSFAAATAAVSLFGTESEDVQKAAAAASNLLTLALSARGLAEVKLGAQLVARTISERAAAAANALSRQTNLTETASLEASTTAFAANSAAEVANTTVSQANVVATTEGTVAANVNTAAVAGNTVATGAAATTTGFFTTALQTLYATMAANPYGVIIAALGLLITAYLALGKSQEEEAVKLKSINDLRREGAAQTENEITKIQILTSIINDNNASLFAREGAYAQLQKLIPELSELTLEEAKSQGVLNEAIDREIELIKLRAEQKAIENFLIQETEEALRKESIERKKRLEDLKEEGFLQDFVNGFRVFILRQAPAINKNQKEINRLEAQGTVGKKDLANVITKITDLEGKRIKTGEKSKKITKDNTEAEERRKKEIEALSNALKSQIEAQTKLLFQSFSLDGSEAPLLAKLKDRVKTSEDLAKNLEKLKSVSELYAEVQKELVGEQDLVGKAFLKATQAGETYFNILSEGTKKQNVKERQEQINKGLEDYRKKLEEVRLEFGDNFSPEQLLQLSNLQLTYENLADSLSKFVQIKPTFDTAAWEREITDFALATGQILTDPYKRSEEEINKAKAKALLSVQNSEKEFINAFVAFELKANEQTVKRLEKQKDGKELVAKLTKDIEAQGKIAFEALQKQGIEILKFEDGVRTTNAELIKLNKTLRETREDAKEGFIVANAEEIAKQYDTVFIPLVLRKEEELAALQDKIRTKNFEKDEKYNDAILLLETELINQGIDITQMSYETKLGLLEKFLSKSVEKQKNADDEQKENLEKNLKNISDYIQQFSSFVGEVGSLVQQSLSFQLEQLEKNAKLAQEQVIGDTEEANKKRLELEEQYQVQRAALEKKATVKALQIQLVQAIADGAAATIQGFIDGGPPLAIVAGALAAFQVGIIAKQLNAAQSMAGGGLIFGPTHENGGVYAGGGINVEGGESVINKVSTVQYGSLLSSINQMGGGKPIINNAQNGLMEERLLQAIAKTNNQPIRAYVLNSEITSGQAINRRLSELATL